MKKINLILFIVIGFLQVNAQKLYKLQIKNNSIHSEISKIDYKKEFYDTLERKKELYNYLNKLYEKGYLAAYFDSIRTTDSVSMLATIIPGKIYKWVIIKKANVDEDFLKQFTGRKNIDGKTTMLYSDIIKLNKKIIEHFENNGYPFVSVKLDSIETDSNVSKAVLNIERNKKYNIDSIIVKGNAKISKRYLFGFLGIEEGSVYDESQIKKISARLKEISFIKEAKSYNLIFTPKYSKIILYLQKNKSSQFDGIVGFKQNDKNPSKIDLTGEVHLNLINSFGRGEFMSFNWRSLQEKTQDLKINFTYPYLFSTPFGIDLKFSIYKKDTTYITITRNIGIQYFFSGRDYLKFFLDNKSSNILSTVGLKSTTVLPDYADIENNIYGLEFKREHLDYVLNPRRGHFIKISIGAGTKNIKKNSEINSEVYNNIKLNSEQYHIESELDNYFSVSHRSVIKLGSQCGWIINDNLFQNELFKIGGLKTLRGFDEESIFASKYSILTAEYRFLFEEKSYLFGFFDWAYYENFSSNKKNIHDTPYGFGAGISFETKAGIFSISYALGKQFNNPIYFKNSKVHFGIVNYF
ncbi:MAG: hypothetical protein WC223_07395 [Bacteroidales bacterium]